MPKSKSWIVTIHYFTATRVYVTQLGVSARRSDARRFPTPQAAQAEVDDMPPDMRATAEITAVAS